MGFRRCVRRISGYRIRFPTAGFLGYSLLDEIPHFATVSYAFCKRFPPELSEEIFAHILNKALNNRMVDPSMIFIDGTHIKASANKKKFQKEQVAKAAKVYEEQLRKEVSEEREKLGKKVNDDDDDENKGSSGGGTVEKTVSKTDPDCGMFVKGAHERQFAYEAHTACDKHGGGQPGGLSRLFVLWAVLAAVPGLRPAGCAPLFPPVHR